MNDKNLLKTNLKTGLSSEEVEIRKKKFGLNEIKTYKEFSFVKSFFHQFKDFMIILLLVAATISFAVAIYEHVKGKQNFAEIIIQYIEPLIILIVVFLNSLLGTYQEFKSNQAVKALEKNNQLSSKVIRNDKLIVIPASEITIGDLIVVESGDYICADAKIIESNSFKVVESILTGESLPVDKHFSEENFEKYPLGDQINKIFSGTYVTNGRAIALVVAIGNKTEVGKINNLISEQKPPLTPLQLKLNKLSRIFGISGVILFLFTTLIQILLNGFFGLWSEPEIYSSALVIGISLAVAAIPEGLITFTTVLLAIGVAHMTKQKAIIKSFTSIESLGSTQIICSDKTGTLTENKMKVVDFWDFEYPENIPSKSKALSSFVLCCDAKVYIDNQKNIKEVGDPTEIGILKYALDHSLEQEKLQEKYHRISSLPFDSDRKLMSVLIQGISSKVIITKGAPDAIFQRCFKTPEKAYKLNEHWSEQSYRVIAVAYKTINNNQNHISYDDEKDLTFLGLIAMIDPPRASVKESILQAQKSGIKTVMITGDHLTTAVAIAKQLNIYNNDDLAINGEQLSIMNDEQLKNNVKKISVYARVNPIDKLRIVKAWQSHDKVVAMTGDGVNDAPALKAADVGCAMGITGTDVSKQASDVILTDDNFNTIVNAVKSGRETYKKIKTVILNLLISSMSEIIVMLIGLFVFRFIFKTSIDDKQFFVLSASQLLWINLLTHGLPAIALGMSPIGGDVMKEKPVHKNESIFARGMGRKLLVQSCILSGFALLAYLIVGFIAQKQSIQGEEFVKLTSSACFITLGIGASLNSINLMSKQNIYKCSIKKFYLVYGASLFSLICVLSSTFIPGFANVFRNIPVSYYSKNALFWIVPIFLGFGLIFYNEINKLIIKKTNSKNILI